MSDFRDKITNHFKNKLNGELNKISVPEWEMDIYYKATYPFVVESKIIQQQADGKVVEALVEAIIQKALTPDGKPMFQSADRNMLLHQADPDVLVRIAGAINSATTEYNYEEVGKN